MQLSRGQVLAIALLGSLLLALLASCSSERARRFAGGWHAYAETSDTTFDGPKGGAVRSHEAEGWTVGLLFDLGALLPAEPQHVVIDRLPPALELAIAQALAGSRVMPATVAGQPHDPVTDARECTSCQRCGVDWEVLESEGTAAGACQRSSRELLPSAPGPESR